MSEPEYQFEKTALRKFLLNRRSSYTKDQKITNKEVYKTCKNVGGRSLIEQALGKDLPGGNSRKNKNSKI